MKLKLLSWNVRGANNLDKRKIICNFVRSQRVDLGCIQETKIQKWSNAYARSLGVSRFHDWKALEAEGAVGDILLFWDKQKMDQIQAEIGSFSITSLFKNVEDRFMWAFTGVYGPVERRNKENF